MFTALQQCWERSISSLLAVLKFYHLTFDLFLPVIQEEIPFNESSIFTFALCNLLFVSVGFHCQITEVLLTTLFCPYGDKCGEHSSRLVLFLLALLQMGWNCLLRPCFIFAMGWNWLGAPSSFSFAVAWSSKLF